MKRTGFFFLFLLATLISQETVSVRYYLSEPDILTGKAIRASEKLGKEHIALQYDTDGKVRSKSWFGEDAIRQKEEIFEYKQDGLVRRSALLDGLGKLIRMTIYGGEEMSLEFFEYVYPTENVKLLKGRYSVYEFNANGTIHSCHFFSVGKEEWGTIKYLYREDGFLEEELWFVLPGDRLVKRYFYDFRPSTQNLVVIENDAAGKEISNVGFSLTNEIRESILSGLSLDEQLHGKSVATMRKLLKKLEKEDSEKESQKELSTSGKMKVDDSVALKNGQTFQGKLVEINGGFVQFIIKGDKSVIHLPIESIEEVENRKGEIVFPPILYPTKE